MRLLRRREHVSAREVARLRRIAATRLLVTLEGPAGRGVLVDTSAEEAYLSARFGSVGDYGQPIDVGKGATLWLEFREG